MLFCEVVVAEKCHFSEIEVIKYCVKVFVILETLEGKLEVVHYF